MHFSSFKIVAFFGLSLVVVANAGHAETAPEIAVASQACPAGHAMMFSNQAQKVPSLADKTAKKELAYWNEIKQTGDTSQLLVYITNFPSGMFVEAAVALYKKRCGDLTVLPVKVLSCMALPPPAPVASPPPKKTIFIPPPVKISGNPPPVLKIKKIPVHIVKRPKKPIICPYTGFNKIAGCKGSNDDGFDRLQSHTSTPPTPSVPNNSNY